MHSQLIDASQLMSATPTSTKAEEPCVKVITQEAMLAETGADFLMIRFRSRFEEIDPRCETCGANETLEHVILNCHEMTSSDEEIRK